MNYILDLPCAMIDTDNIGTAEIISNEIYSVKIDCRRNNSTYRCSLFFTKNPETSLLKESNISCWLLLGKNEWKLNYITNKEYAKCSKSFLPFAEFLQDYVLFCKNIDGLFFFARRKNSNTQKIAGTRGLLITLAD